MKHHRHRRGGFKHFVLSYPISLAERIYSIFIGPIIAVVLIILTLKLLAISPAINPSAISLSDLLRASSYTILRLTAAFGISLAVAIPLAIFATSSRFAEKIFLPMFDILESMPVLAFFPVLIIFFVKFGYLNWAAIFLLAISMLWNIVFTVVGGIKAIPPDIASAAFVFKIKGLRYIREVILPAIFPQIVIGSILAIAQGWNLIIVAEVMHVYIPGGTSAQDLFGLGSMLVRAVGAGRTDLFIIAMVMMVVIIALINFFIWQKLLHYAQKFRFE